MRLADDKIEQAILRAEADYRHSAAKSEISHISTFSGKNSATDEFFGGACNLASFLCKLIGVSAFGLRRMNSCKKPVETMNWPLDGHD